MVSGIDHIEMAVADVDEYTAFLEALGFEVVARTTHHGGSVELRLPGTERPIIELHKVMGEENPGVNHIAFACEDVAAAHGELARLDVRLDTGPFRIASTGRTAVNLRDPDGRRIQLVDVRRTAWQAARRKR